jgi:hypothetical protein
MIIDVCQNPNVSSGRGGNVPIQPRAYLVIFCLVVWQYVSMRLSPHAFFFTN